MAADPGFQPYGASHLVAIGVMVVGGLVVVLIGRRQRDRDAPDRLGRILAVALLGFGLPLQVLYFFPPYWNLDTTLPLQLCDIATVVAAYALWTHRWWATALTYFWGLTLTTQAIATPALDQVFPEVGFLLFWGMHIGTVWAAVHLTWGRGLPPDWRGYRVAVATTAVWAVLVYCFNLVAETNYGYLNAKPGSASALDLLGPWPWYVAWEAVIIATAWALLTWPWVRHRAAGRIDRG